MMTCSALDAPGRSAGVAACTEGAHASALTRIVRAAIPLAIVMLGQLRKPIVIGIELCITVTISLAILALCLAVIAA